MPAKNSIKQFIENGYYHLYNRGVEKRNIFLDDQDYSVFISYIKQYLKPHIGSDPKKSFSSYDYYLGRKHAAWLKPDEVLSFFKNARKTNLKDYLSYESFVDDYILGSEEILGGLTMED